MGLTIEVMAWGDYVCMTSLMCFYQFRASFIEVETQIKDTLKEITSQQKNRTLTLYDIIM